MPSNVAYHPPHVHHLMYSPWHVLHVSKACRLFSEEFEGMCKLVSFHTTTKRQRIRVCLRKCKLRLRRIPCPLFLFFLPVYLFVLLFMTLSFWFLVEIQLHHDTMVSMREDVEDNSLSWVQLHLPHELLFLHT
jgi:hypothetical protein